MDWRALGLFGDKDIVIEWMKPCVKTDKQLVWRVSDWFKWVASQLSSKLYTGLTQKAECLSNSRRCCDLSLNTTTMPSITMLYRYGDESASWSFGPAFTSRSQLSSKVAEMRAFVVWWLTLTSWILRPWVEYLLSRSQSLRITEMESEQRPLDVYWSIPSLKIIEHRSFHTLETKYHSPLISRTTHPPLQHLDHLGHCHSLPAS